MKKSISVLVVLICSSVLLYSIEPPVDILELDYDRMINSGEGELSGNYASFPGTVKYLGEEITYSSSFNLDDRSKRFLFFSRDYVDKDTFYEYCREIIKYYMNESSFFRVENSFTLSRDNQYITIQDLYFFIKDKPVIDVYIKNSHDEGIYGFGIQPINNDFVFEDEPLQRVDLLTGNTINSIDAFNYEESYSNNIIFASEDEFIKKGSVTLSNEGPGRLIEDKNEYIIGRTVLLPKTEKIEESYTVTIDSQNLDGIKQVYFISNHYGSRAHVYAGEEIDLNDKTFLFYSEIDDLVLFKEFPYTLEIGSAYSNSLLTVLFKYSSEQKDESSDFTIDIKVVESEE